MSIIRKYMSVVLFCLFVLLHLSCAIGMTNHNLAQNIQNGLLLR